MDFFHFLIAAFFSEIMATIAGFGAATILTPIAALFFETKGVIFLAAIDHLPLASSAKATSEHQQSFRFLSI